MIKFNSKVNRLTLSIKHAVKIQNQLLFILSLLACVCKKRVRKNTSVFFLVLFLNNILLITCLIFFPAFATIDIVVIVDTLFDRTYRN